MIFNIFNYINIAIIVLILLPELIGRMRHKLPSVGEHNSFLDFGFSASKFLCMALMVLPLMVKGGQFYLQKQMTMYIWLITIVVLLIAYYTCWAIYKNPVYEKGAVAGILVIPAVIFADTGMRFSHLWLVLTAILHIVCGLGIFSRYIDNGRRAS